MPGDDDQAERRNPLCPGYAVADPDDRILHYCSACERPLDPAKKRPVEFLTVQPLREGIAAELVRLLGAEGFALRETAPGVFRADTAGGPVSVVLVAFCNGTSPPELAMNPRPRAVYLLSSASEERRVPRGQEWVPLLEALADIGPVAAYLRAAACLVSPWSLAPDAPLPPLRGRPTPAPRSDPTMLDRTFAGLVDRARLVTPARGLPAIVREPPPRVLPLLGVPPADAARIIADAVTHEGCRELRMDDLRLLRERAREYRLFADASGATLRDAAGVVTQVEMTRYQLLLLGELATRRVPLAASELHVARAHQIFNAERLIERLRARIDTRKSRYVWTLLHTCRGEPKLRIPTDVTGRSRAT